MLLAAHPARWRIVSGATIALALAMIAVAGWPSIESKGKITALALAVPGGGSIHHSLADLAGNPALDPRDPVGAALLARHLPPATPALVVSEPDLTTEILMRAGRRNLLPISHLPEDTLIGSSRSRVREASRRLAAGTLLLTSPPLLAGAPPKYNELQVFTRAVLYRHFILRVIERTPEGLELVRLVARPESRRG
jgi:hypothetical protein